MQITSKINIVGLVFVLAASSWASGGIRLSFTTASSDNSFQVGENAEVKLSVCDRKGNAVTDGIVTMWADDGWTNILFRQTFNLTADNTPSFDVTRKTPGVIRVYAKHIGSECRTIMDRVVFGKESIMPLTQYPADFEEYWKGEKVRLDREVPLKVSKELAPDLSDSNNDVYRMSFSTFGGKKVYGFLRVPKSGKGPYPVVVNVPGAGRGEWSASRRYYIPGYISLTLNLHNFRPGRNSKEQTQLFRKYLNRLNRESGEPKYQRYGWGTGRIDAPIYHDMILGMTRAIEWLSKEPYVNSKRIVYHGGSQGGGCGIYLTALWGKFYRTIVRYPNMCDMLAYKYGREPGSEHIKDLQPFHRPKAEKIAPYYDACNFARIIKTPVRMFYGTADDNCITTGGIAAFNVLASKDKALVLYPRRGHGWRGDVHIFREWLYEK